MRANGLKNKSGAAILLIFLLSLCACDSVDKSILANSEWKRIGGPPDVYLRFTEKRFYTYSERENGCYYSENHPYETEGNRIVLCEDAQINFYLAGDTLLFYYYDRTLHHVRSPFSEDTLCIDFRYDSPCE